MVSQISGTGYIFIGWRADDATKTAYQAGAMIGAVTKDTVLTAQWRAVHTVSYASGTEEPVNDLPASASVASGDDYQIPETTPSRSGYRFLGYLKDEADETLYAEGQKLTNVSADVLLTAQWQAEYTVSYQAGTTDEIENLPAQATVLAGNDYLISNKTPTREGHRFTGWRQLETETAYQPKDTISAVSANIILVAQWSAQYHISYAKGTGDAVTGLPAGKTVSAGTTYQLSTELPTRADYDFIGWRADDEAETFYQAGGSIVNVQSDIVLTAQWSKPLKVSYAKGTSDLVIGLPPQATVRVGADYQIPATETPVRLGYVFTGWQADDETKTAYQAGDTLEKLSRDTILTAQWAKQYRISYAKGTGDEVTGLPASSFVAVGSDYQVSSEIPVRSGYTFTSWRADDESETVYQGQAMIQAIQRNLVLTAQWEAVKAETETPPTKPSDSQKSEAAKSSELTSSKQQKASHDRRNDFSLPRTGETFFSPLIGFVIIGILSFILWYKRKRKNKD